MAEAEGRSTRWLVAAQVGQFALAGLIALVVVALATGVASRRVGEREAISNARTSTLLTAQGVVEPHIEPGLLDGDADAIGALDDVVRADVLDRSLVRVKVWSREGRILYSDEPRLIGADYGLDEEERESIETGRIEAEVSDLDGPENRFEQDQGRLLEVYLPIEGPGGEALLFEAYYRYQVVEENGSELWRSFAPIALGALVMLELVQVPLAWSLARRLRQRLREREELLRRSLDASEVERRQIASDLHDGVVQDLTGVGFALSAAARDPDRPLSVAELEAAADTVRDAVRDLRSLIVDLDPPSLREEGLASALTDLLTRAEAAGLATSLDDTALRDPVPPAVASLLFRAAQEGVRNVLKHASASRVAITVTATGRTAAVAVEDDGVGVDPATVAARAEAGHVGLKVLRGLVGDAGGSLDLRAAPDAGTILTVEVPLP